MEAGLAMTYGSGEGQNTTHYYGGTIDKPRKKKEDTKMACKKKPKPKPSK